MIDMEQALRNIGKASDIPQVSLEPVVIKNEDTNYVAVVEDKSNQTLGIASKKYQLVQHRDVYDAITKLNGYKIRSAKLYKNGARMIIEIEDSNAPAVEILPKDEVIPMARVLNSYDSSLSITVSSFGIRKICTNGMIAPVATKWVSSNLHIGDNIDLDRLKADIIIAMEKWNESKTIIAKADTAKVDVNVALFYMNLPEKHKQIAFKTLKKEDTIFKVWNEVTRILSHELDGLAVSTKTYYQKKANEVFDFLKMTDKQVAAIADELKEFTKKNIKK